MIVVGLIGGCPVLVRTSELLTWAAYRMRRVCCIDIWSNASRRLWDAAVGSKRQRHTGAQGGYIHCTIVSWLIRIYRNSRFHGQWLSCAGACQLSPSLVVSATRVDARAEIHKRIHHVNLGNESGNCCGFTADVFRLWEQHLTHADVWYHVGPVATEACLGPWNCSPRARLGQRCSVAASGQFCSVRCLGERCGSRFLTG